MNYSGSDNNQFYLLLRFKALAFPDSLLDESELGVKLLVIEEIHPLVNSST
jgi:hypothetical protein